MQLMVWQMATDNVPFKGMTRDDFIARVAKRDERPAMERSPTLSYFVYLPSRTPINTSTHPINDRTQHILSYTL